MSNLLTRVDLKNRYHSVSYVVFLGFVAFHCRNLCRKVKHTRQTLHIDSAAKFLEVKYLGNGVTVVVRNAHTEYEFTNYQIFPKKEQMC